MNQLLLERSTGVASQQAFARFTSTYLTHSIQPAPRIRFDGGGEKATDSETRVELRAHDAGVNTLVVDRFEAKFLLSGGADPSIKLWNIQDIEPGTGVRILKPTGTVARGPLTHKFGITHVSFYPFDYNAFLSSSYDHTLKLYSSDSLAVSSSFELGSIVYAHAMSPIASHLLVACATQHPNIRLVDLRSGNDIQALTGHQSAVLAVAWSPKNEHILASGGVDGTVRLWDVRRSSPNLSLLDMEDFVGVTGYDGLGTGASPRFRGRAHSGAVNGLSWTDDGNYLVTAGHDNRVRVWDAAIGANTLVSFGPTIKNTRLFNLSLLISPTSALPPGKELLFYPNEQEILVFKLHKGRLIKRLKIPGPAASTVSRTSSFNVRNRTTGLSWCGPADGIVSGNLDGQIRAWIPRTHEDENAEAGVEDTSHEGEGAGNKRKALDDVFRDLTRPKITFT